MQAVYLIDIDALFIPEDSYDQCKTDSNLRSGNCHDKENENLPVQGLVHTGKSNKRQVCGIQH